MAKVLYLEENQTLRESMVELLTQIDGHEVSEYANAATALHTLKSEGPFDLIMTNHFIDGANSKGIKLAREMRSASEKTPILLLGKMEPSQMHRDNPDFESLNIKYVNKERSYEVLQELIRSTLHRSTRGDIPLRGA